MTLKDLFYNRISEIDNELIAKSIKHKWLTKKIIEIQSEIIQSLPYNLKYLVNEYEQTTIKLESIYKDMSKE